MIIISNNSGKLLLLIAICGAVGVALFTNSMIVTLLCFAATLAVFGGSRVDPETKQKRPAPSLYFIPLRWIGFLLILLTIPVMFLDRAKKRQLSEDARVSKFESVDRLLGKEVISGDPVLAQRIYSKLDGAGSGMHLHCSLDGNRALLLVKVPGLKDYSEPARRNFIEKISAVISGDAVMVGREIYIGIKGKLLYGGMKLPNGEIEVGSSVNKEKLLAYFGPKIILTHDLPATLPAK